MVLKGIFSLVVSSFVRRRSRFRALSGSRKVVDLGDGSVVGRRLVKGEESGDDRTCA